MFPEDECESGHRFNRDFLINPNEEWKIKTLEDLSLHQSSRSTQPSVEIGSLCAHGNIKNLMSVTLFMQLKPAPGSRNCFCLRLCRFNG